MLLREDRRPTLRLGKRHVLVFATVLLSVLGAPTGAYAQAACDASAVDQYVECIPTSDGDDANNESGAGGGGNGGGGTTLSPSVSSQIDSQAGSDAPLLKEVASSPRYGAPTKKLKVPAATGTNGKARIGKEQMVQADPQADVSAGDALSAAAGAVGSGDAARLIGLLVALFLVSAATLAAAAARQKRRTPLT